MQRLKTNRNQEKAIRHAHGPLIVIAGPGSGKTYTITERVAYLITELKADPGSILVMTFSRAAALEMKERFIAKGITGGQQVTFGTFHSVFYRVLLTAYGSTARNYIFDDESREKIRFDEMLVLTKELLEKRKDIRDSLRRKYRWILIDEFQDIDEVQYDIVRMIAPPKKWFMPGRGPDITVVGDDDQSIYAFRGARPEYMLKFQSVYAGTKKVILNINYRSTSQIVDAASQMISHNKERLKKKLVSGSGRGEKVEILEFNNAREEYQYIAERINDELAAGDDPAEIAILYRNNIQLDRLRQVLDEEGIADIRTMTFHRSKGLEFKEVWIIDANEGNTPSYKAKSRVEQEEERRAFYVAMTRAKEKLYITCCRAVREREALPSRYIKEIKRR